MKKAFEKKPSTDNTHKSKRDSRCGALKNSHAISADFQVPFIQRKPACPCGGGCPRCTPVIQPKLTIGQPNDKSEQEADRVADQVMRVPETLVQSQPEEEKEEEIRTRSLAEQITPLVQSGSAGIRSSQRNKSTKLSYRLQMATRS